MWFYAVLCFLAFSNRSYGIYYITVKDDYFPLSVIHVNDLHARYDETSLQASTCTNPPTCIGGFSRFAEEINNMLSQKPKNPIVLNAGDNFQGTLFYTLGKWNITQEFLNKVPFDAITIGNHEFDDGISGIVPFLKHLKAPVVCANIDDSEEPDMQGTYNKSIIIERDGKKIGIIGVLYAQTNEISSGTGKLKFYPESETVNAEAERLVKEEGVFTNIILSHCGYDIDKQIAANASEKIGLIVGGHSHTFLYSGDNPPGPDTPAGPYPTIVKSKNGKNVLIVQASSYLKYLGNITVYYDHNGEIADYEGSPIFLENSLPKDEEINTALIPWDELVKAQGSVVLGSTMVELSMSNCYFQECNIGNFLADAFVYEYTSSAPEGSWTRAAIGIITPGSIRTGIDIGNITYSILVDCQPFANTIDFGQIQGKYLKETLEQGTQVFTDQRVVSETHLLQVSGLRIVYNLTRPYGERVQEVKVRCQKCDIPIYEELDLNATYNIAVPSYLSSGGEGFTALSENLQNLVTGNVDTDVITKYLAVRSPVFEEEEGRITVISDHKILFYSNP